PFFIINKPCFVSGRGELIENFPMDLSAYSFVLIHPGIHIDTALAFSKIIPSLPLARIREIVQLPVSDWKSSLTNDFEHAAFTKYPLLSDIKKNLYESGALYASMTGSGSSLYGIFKKNTIPSFSFDR